MKSSAPSKSSPGRLLAGLALVAMSCQAAAPDPRQPPASRSLCAAQEQAYFSCTLRETGKLVSLCAVEEADGSASRMVYRYGRRGKVELEAPPAEDRSRNDYFRASAYTRAQITRWSVSFRRDGYRYELFDDYDGEGQSPRTDRGLRIWLPIRSADGQPRIETLRCMQPDFSRLSRLQSQLPCDEAASLGGCKPK
ncbi:MAG: hypothetical protein KGL43_01120 [Burkholderiales bacterium]|nr:hypothetical protein [Burkholderiales bacterium]MDE2394547.1 hypothetical protein [Burkholderiales bacterium]MDE2452168.1 hypothetical protein [Burkholderiales bacterium]